MRTEIPLTGLWTQALENRPVVHAAVSKVLDRGQFILGEEVCAFEQEFSAFLGMHGGVGVGSGTDAITLGLMAGEIAQGDEVLIPAFCPGATITGILATGARPVLIDVGLDYEVDLESLRRAITRHTKAIVVAHLFGRMQDMVPVCNFAREHGLWIVEDCAQAHGAKQWIADSSQWRFAGTLGDVGAFSFYPTKNLGALGDGGYCGGRNAQTVERLRELRQYGWRQRDDSLRIGRNSRLDEIQAAVLRIGLPMLADWNARRKAIAKVYLELLRSEQEQGTLVLPRSTSDREDVYHLFVIRTPNREDLRNILIRNGVGTGIHYPKALTQQVAYAQFGSGGTYARAEALAASVLSLPMHPWLSAESARDICSLIRENV